MNHDFKDFPCNNCGWCCQRTPCPVALYLGQQPLTSCGFLKETSPLKFECGLLLDEKDPIKFEALKTLLLAGEGCSHIYGPSPVSLMRELVKRGLAPTHSQWSSAKENTLAEYKKMAKNNSRPDDIFNAIKEFEDYCLQIESKQLD